MEHPFRILVLPRSNGAWTGGIIRWHLLILMVALAVIAVRLWLDLTGRRPGGGFVGAIIGYPYFWFNVL